MRWGTKKRKKKNADDDEDEDEGEVSCQNNHVYFYGDVSSKNMLEINQYLNSLNQPGKRYGEIYLHINSGGGNITITGNIAGSDGDEVLILDDNGDGSGGVITIGAEGAAATIGGSNHLKTINLIGAGGVKLSGNVTTAATAGGNVTITGPVTLVEDVIIDADAANTTVSFGSTSTVNSDSTSGGHSLTIKTAGGKVTMDAAIGNATPLKT